MKGFGLYRFLPWLVLATAAFVWYSDPAFVKGMRLKVFDIYQQTWQREEPEDFPVYIVDVDEKSLAELGQWPWPRTVLADLTEKVFAAGASSLAFDMVFAEADRTSPENVVGNWPVADDVKAELGALPSNDDVFAASLDGKNVTLGFTFEFEGAAQVDEEFYPFSGVAAKQVVRDVVPVAASAVRNLPVLEDSAAAIGWFGYMSDGDGIIRHVPTLVRYGEELFPALSLEILRLASGARGVVAISDVNGMVGIKVGEMLASTDAIGRLWVRFRKHSDANYVSAVDVIKGRIAADKLRGKMVLVGASAKGLLDQRATPLDGVVAGVDVHAQVIENILEGNFLHRPLEARLIELIFLLTVGALLIAISEFFGAVRAALAAVLLVGSAVGVGCWLFVTRGILFDPVFPFLALLAVYIVQTVIKYAREEAAKAAIKGAFSRYISPDMVKIVAKQPEKLQLGGVERNMTVFFSDIRGFTSISEAMTPQELGKFMNDYLSPLTEVVQAHKGTIDKYIGDAVMAFWNAPLEVENHAEMGCKAALAVQKTLAKKNKEWTKKGLPVVNTGIGINTANVSVGNFGSSQRFDYTLLGDGVNLASRLEGLCKPYGVGIVVSENVVAQVPNGIFMPLDLVVVKGKTKPVEVFELMAFDEVSADVLEEINAVQLALFSYRGQQWDEAERWLEKVKLHDVLKTLYLERIAHLRENPPPRNWNGAEIRTSK